MSPNSFGHYIGMSSFPQNYNIYEVLMRKLGSISSRVKNVFELVWRCRVKTWHLKERIRGEQ